MMKSQKWTEYSASEKNEPLPGFHSPMPDHQQTARLIYYVEDDKELAKEVRHALQQQGMRVEVFSTLHQLNERLQSVRALQLPDLLLLDWNLPDGSGVDLLCKLKEWFSDLPVLIISVHSDPDDLLHGFQYGADEYITKPFDLRILVCRIQALLRRSRPALSVMDAEDGDWLVCGAISMDVSANRVYVMQQEVYLSALEFLILKKLLENQDRTITRSVLQDTWWELKGTVVNDNSLTVAMKRLRTKLGHPSYLKTIRSFGYRLESQKDWSAQARTVDFSVMSSSLSSVPDLSSGSSLMKKSESAEKTNRSRKDQLPIPDEQSKNISAANTSPKENEQTGSTGGRL